MQSEVEKRFQDAVDSVTEKLKKDRSILAVILFGSLSYDKVWEKSDVDMAAIVRDDQKIAVHSYCIDEDDIVINLDIITRANFTKQLNKSIGGLISHSIFSRGKILFTRDESLCEHLDDAIKIGRSDMEMSAFWIAENIVANMQKTEKWIRVKNDVTYSRYYLLKLADAIARMEICLRLESPSREAILRATEINPSLMDKFYYQPMNNSLNADEILGLLKDVDEYLESHMDVIAKPLLNYLTEDEPKTVTALSRYFHIDGHSLTHLTEYLKDKGIIEKASEMIRVTPKGRPIVEEIAYLAGGF